MRRLLLTEEALVARVEGMDEEIEGLLAKVERMELEQSILSGWLEQPPIGRWEEDVETEGAVTLATAQHEVGEDELEDDGAVEDGVEEEEVEDQNDSGEDEEGETQEEEIEAARVQSAGGENAVLEPSMGDLAGATASGSGSGASSQMDDPSWGQ